MYSEKDVPYTLDMSQSNSSVLKYNHDKNCVDYVDTTLDLSKYSDILNNKGFYLQYSEIVHRHTLVQKMPYFTERSPSSIKLTHSYNLVLLVD